MPVKTCTDVSKEWDKRAHGDYRWSIWAEASESEEAFRASGERDYKRYVQSFLSSQGLDPARLVALEIGAGVGRMSEFVSRHFRAVLAVDPSREMLRIGRKRVGRPNVLWLCNDGKDLRAVADASVDFIFSLSVFQHIPRAEDVARYIEEAARVLRPGGWLVFQVMNQPHLSLGSWSMSLIVSHRFRVPRVRVHRRHVLEVCPIRIGPLRQACRESGLELARILHRMTQNTWIWARKAA
jgi:ubiquinone/menaquinone biosynthesis C-methylase UbiE